MQTIRKVLQRKQAQYAQLAKEIELLQQAEEKFREIAPLLADDEDDDSALLVEVDVDDTQSKAGAAKAASATATGNPAPAAAADPSKPLALRWP